MEQLAIIGREKDLAYAEAESIFGSITKLNDYAISFNTPHQAIISHLGSIIKLGVIIKTTATKSSLTNAIVDLIIDQFRSTQVNSVDFGVSVYGDMIDDKEYKRILIEVKKSLKSQKIKCRFVLPKVMQLNAAQIIHNNLIKNGIEILVVQNNSNFIIAKTTDIQDINSYSLRDFGRPNRDMKVGMFPPKLAQTMLNLANPDSNTTIYDPFCGSGVVLQEALLRGLVAWGSDNSDKMVGSTIENLNWLASKFHLTPVYEVFQADATDKLKLPPSPYSIVTEGFLGSMLSSPPDPVRLVELRSELSQLYLSFFRNITNFVNKPTSIVITLPCWQIDNQLEMLNIVDQIINLGYTIKQFRSTDSSYLIYKRPNQIVGRQIIICNLNQKGN